MERMSDYSTAARSLTLRSSSLSWSDHEDYQDYGAAVPPNHSIDDLMTVIIWSLALPMVIFSFLWVWRTADNSSSEVLFVPKSFWVLVPKVIMLCPFAETQAVFFEADNWTLGLQLPWLPVLLHVFDYPKGRLYLSRRGINFDCFRCW